jgi:hypothetical protein
VSDEKMLPLDGDNSWYVSEWARDELGVTHALATAVQYQNDEGHWPHYVSRKGESETPEQRYERVLGWVRSWLKVEDAA